MRAITTKLHFTFVQEMLGHACNDRGIDATTQVDPDRYVCLKPHTDSIKQPLSHTLDHLCFTPGFHRTLASNVSMQTRWSDLGKMVLMGRLPCLDSHDPSTVLR